MWQHFNLKTETVSPSGAFLFDDHGTFFTRNTSNFSHANYCNADLSVCLEAVEPCIIRSLFDFALRGYERSSLL